MRILITGGAGFIGSHLSEHLLREGFELGIIDDLNDFYPPELKRQNLEAVRLGGRFTFFECDIRDRDAMHRVFAQFQPEAVVHLAARAGVRPSVADPLLYESVNVGGTVTLLEACRQFGVRKFVFASSSSVYGATDRLPFREDDGSNLPVSPYAATKIAGEKFCYTYSHLYDIRTVCLRFFTVYGPRQRPDLAIRKFVEMIDLGRPVPMFGDGSSGRDYTYIDDIVAGIRAALLLDCPYDIFNLGNSNPVDLLTLIRTLEDALQKKAILQRLELQPGDVPFTYADIGKARRQLGFEPATPFAEGIRRFVAWYRRRLDASA